MAFVFLRTAKNARSGHYFAANAQNKLNFMNAFKFRTWLITLLSIILLYLILLFLRVNGYFPTPTISTALDANLIELMSAWRSPEWIKIFMGVTLLGEAKFVVALAGILSICLGLWKKSLFILPIWIVLAGTEICVLLGKMSLMRERPSIAVYLEPSASFPSGHAAIAVALYGLLGYLLGRRFKKTIYRALIGFLAAILILAIGFSRLYLGVHYFSDVIVGFMLGALWLTMGIVVTEFILSRKRKIPPSSEKYLI